MIFYQVNNKIIYNIYLAQYESYTSGQPITFHCMDQANDQLDWTIEPELSFESLMDSHAIHLRNKYERLILNWSGGTDSHTIYNVFKRNNIHIDEIVIKYAEPVHGITWFPRQHYDWMMVNHYDPTTKITAVNAYDTDKRKLFIDNEDWILKNKGNWLAFNLSHVEDSYNHCAESYSGHNWGIIFGFEKPQVYAENGTWYYRQADVLMRSVMGYSNVECFYMDPLINLKQSHMAKRALKAMKRDGVEPGNPAWHAGGNLKYKMWARAIGRHHELSDGISNSQKENNAVRGNSTVDIQQKFEDFDPVNGEIFLREKIRDQDPVAVNYLRGIYNVMLDRNFYEHLNQHSLREPGKFFKTKTIWSKSYCLGQ